MVEQFNSSSPEKENAQPRACAIACSSYNDGSQIFGYILSKEAAEKLEQQFNNNERADLKDWIERNSTLIDLNGTVSQEISNKIPWAHAAFFPGVANEPWKRGQYHQPIKNFLQSINALKDLQVVKLIQW